jgi:iron complex transport system ATP-binding protein
MIEIEQLSFSYHARQAILDGLSFQVKPGEIWVILGPNGTGKTTLLRLMLGLVTPQKGRITLNGLELGQWPDRERARQLAYVPQEFSTGFAMTVFETVLLGRRPYINWGPARQDINKTAEVLELLKLSHLSQRAMSTLSGGQKQKVVLARALAQETQFLLLDEPTGNLDLKHQVEVLDCLAQAASVRGVGVVIAMHDVNLAARYANRVLLLNNGHDHRQGTPGDILNSENLFLTYGIAMRAFHPDDDSRERLWFPDLAGGKSVPTQPF